MITPSATYQLRLNDTALANRRKNRCSNSSYQLNNVPWTAARCNRLLRTLALRLDQSCKQQIKEGAHCRNDQVDKRRKHSTDLNVKENKFGKRRKLKHQYTSRSRRAADAVETLDVSTKSDHDGVGFVQVPTPYIARNSRSLHALEDAGESIVNNQGPKEENYLGNESEPRLKQRNNFGGTSSSLGSKKRTNKRNACLDNGLEGALGDFLERTREPGPPRRKGARSLFSLCLKNVPNYIRVETEWRKADDPDDKTDVQSEVYDDLEGLKPTAEGGWNQLRAAALGHGMRLVSQAIRCRQFDETTTSRLIESTAARNALLETQQLIEAFLWQEFTKEENHKTDTLGSRLEKSICLLNDCSKRDSYWTFLMRQLSALFATGKYPIEWASNRQMMKLWTKAVKSLSRMDQDFDAAAQMTLSVLTTVCDSRISMCKKTSETATKREDTLSNTLSSLVTILSTIALTTHPNGTSDITLFDHASSRQQIIGSPGWLIHTTAISIIASWEQVAGRSLIRNEGNDATLRRCSNVLIAELVLQVDLDLLNTKTTTSYIDDCIATIRKIASTCALNPYSEASDILPETVCSIARCYGRTTSSNGLTPLDHLVHRFISYDHGIKLSSVAFLQQLALDSAIYFAQHFDGGAACQAFVGRIEASVRNIGSLQIGATPARKRGKPQQQERSGYRWEDGICEWVMATPVRITSDCASKYDILGLEPEVLSDTVDESSDTPEPRFMPNMSNNRSSSSPGHATNPLVDEGWLRIHASQNQHETNGSNAEHGCSESNDDEQVKLSGMETQYTDDRTGGDRYENMSDLEDELYDPVFKAQVQNSRGLETSERSLKRQARGHLRARRRVQVKQLCRLGNHTSDDSDSDDELCLASHPVV